MKYIALSLLFFISFQGFAQRNVLFNPTCMDRLKYTVTNKYGSQDYIIYAVKLNDNERIFLEVGRESDNFQERIPGSILTCNTSTMNSKLVSTINGGSKFNLVRKEGARNLRISPISNAAYLKMKDTGFDFTGDGYGFEFNMFETSTNMDLALNGSNSRVFYTGASTYNCKSAYNFNVMSNFTNSTRKISVIPEIGIISYGNQSTVNGVRQLATVNATNLQPLIASLCRNGLSDAPIASNNNTTSTTEQLNARGNNTNEIVDLNQPQTSSNARYGMIAAHASPMPTTTTDLSSNNSSNSGQRLGTTRHLVKKQETLYRIAKQYGLSVEALKQMNGLTSNTIYPGNVLTISADFSSDEVLVSKGNAIPTSLVENRGVQPAWKNTTGYHVVQRGETIQSIAAKYGFTEQRFRYINGLNSYEELPAGYRLKSTDCDLDPSMNKTFATQNTEPTFSFETTKGNDFYEDDLSDLNLKEQPTFSYGTAYSTSFSTDGKVHTVQESETLYSIAKRYSTTVSKIVKDNNLDSSELLFPNQKILIKQ